MNSIGFCLTYVKDEEYRFRMKSIMSELGSG